MILFLYNYMFLCAQKNKSKNSKIYFLLKILFSDIYFAMSKNYFNEAGERLKRKYTCSQRGKLFFF